MLDHNLQGRTSPVSEIVLRSLRVQPINAVQHVCQTESLWDRNCGRQSLELSTEPSVTFRQGSK